jgi:hypothetical protein
VILAVVLAAAFVIARSCGSTEADVPKEQAIEIARGEVDYDANEVQIRLVKRGLNQREIWLVSLVERDEADTILHATNVLIDADSGDIVEVQKVT